MADIIREDIVKIGWDIDENPLAEIQKEINNLKKMLMGGVGDDAFDDLKDSINDSNDEMNKAKKAASGADSALDKLKNSASKASSKLKDLGKKGAIAAFNGLKKLAGISFKALIGGVTAVATAVGKVAYEAVQASAEYEQLKGGMEKIFDKADTSKIMEDANNAYKDLGLSANQYLGVINDVGATFAATMGDQKGYDAAKLGLQAISDYASGTGKDVDILSDKFTMITRSTSSYQSIADQFSGILPATSKDFLKQAQSAGILDKKYTELTKVPVAEYQEAVSKMLEKGVKDLGLAGNTAYEAEKTVSGSLSMMKASWSDLMVSFGTGENLDANFDKFIKSVIAFGDNVIPVAEKALIGIGTAVEKLAPIIAEKLPGLADKLLPPLIKAAVELTKGLIKAMPSIIKTLLQTVGDILVEQFPALSKFGEFLKKSGKTIAKFTPLLVGLVGAFLAFKKIKSLTSVFSGLFGKKGGGAAEGMSEKSGLFSGFKELAKLKTTTVLKGMANLAIIFGGFLILAAAFAAVAPHIAKIGDMGDTIKMIAIIAALGLLGGALTKFAGTAGNIPVSTVAKALANMAIMLAGMTALYLLIGAVSLIKFDYGAILSIIGIIAALGLVGGALTIFAGIAGLIPVPVVALGLANMAIIIAGMSALLLLIGAVSLIDFNYGKIMQIVGIIGALGLVGGALSIFAGIVGMIPITIVLAGLANMALVLGGVSAIIVAFGALSKIDGFSDFLTTGGELLVKLFNIIGKIVGSVIGGIGEGLTNSLPKIGANLTAFARSLSPMFTMFKGADMDGIGAFFKAIGTFLVTIAGAKILEFFTGKTDFSGIADGLGTLATGEGVKNFFNMVNGIGEEAFNKGKLFFECLDGIKNLPNSGGLANLFGGKNDFSGVAKGLGDMTTDGVKKFFSMVSGMKEESFTNAKEFFKCLSAVKKLPNAGGLSELFGGKNDFSGVASGLASLGGDGVKKFFTMVQGLDKDTFTKVKSLFTSLSGMGDISTKDSWWDKITGKETTSLSTIADQLSAFGDKTTKFFESVNKLNVDKLNALWSSLKNAGKITTQNLASVFDKCIDDLVSKISKLPQKMGNALKNNKSDLSDGFVDMWKDAVKKSVAPVNKLISGANHLLKVFGSKKSLVSWTPYARGTDGHMGGNALVNDGNGAELVQMPNGNTFIPSGRNVFIPNAPKGMKVLPAEQTAQIMGKSKPTFNYADGIGNIDVWSFFDNSKGLVKKISDNVSYDGMSGFALNLGKGMVSTFTGAMTGWVDKLFEEGAMSLADYDASKGVSQWRSTVIRALKMENQYNAANVKRTLFQMQTESGGNPKAINLWDSNAKKGIPSKGLMQVIDPTFRAYARTGFDKNIYDPLSNILASIRYAVSRYGTLAKAYQGKGYANGGVATSPSVFGEDGAEMAIPLSRSKRKRGISLWQSTGEMLGLPTYTPESGGDEYTFNSVEYNTYSPSLSFTISGTNDDRAIARKIKKAVLEAFNDMVDGADRDNPNTIEV